MYSPPVCISTSSLSAYRDLDTLSASQMSQARLLEMMMTSAWCFRQIVSVLTESRQKSERKINNLLHSIIFLILIMFYSIVDWIAVENMIEIVDRVRKILIGIKKGLFTYFPVLIDF